MYKLLEFQCEVSSFKLDNFGPSSENSIVASLGRIHCYNITIYNISIFNL